MVRTTIAKWRSLPETNRAKRVLVLGFFGGTAVLIGFCVCAVLSARDRRQRGETDLRIESSFKNLGRIACGSEHVVPFQIHNRGSRRLVINRVASGCGCLNSVNRTIFIPPGDSVAVDVTLRGSHVGGPIESVADFTTNDRGKPRFQLVVRADMQPEHERRRSNKSGVSILANP